VKYIFVFLLTFASLAFADSGEPIYATITSKSALLYEAPSTISPIARRILAGEVLKIIGTVKTENGEVWGKVYLAPNVIAYLPGSYFTNAGSVPQQMWQPEEVLRTQKPFSFAAKGTSELFGPGIQARYLPFTRLGITVGGGSVLDDGRAKGFSVAYGIICLISTGNFSPFVETGTSTLTFNDAQSTLRIQTFYINAGVEWIMHSGYFIGAGISYNRSYNVQVAFDYSYAKASSGTLKTGNYGSFGNIDGSESFQRLNPLFLAGYSF
jgi:hypothetical protein